MPPSVPILRLLGAPALLPDGAAPLPLAPKDALLLALLALDGAQPREQLAALLWPANAPGAARANLRQRVKRLQALCAAPLLALQGGTLALAVQPDLQLLPALLQADADAARGDLLGQLRFDDEDSAALWLASARMRVHTARNQALQAQVDSLVATGRPDAAGPWLQRLVADNPADEQHARQLMQWLHQRADRGAAVAAYAALRTTLQREHGTEPDPQTQALAAWISRGGPATTAEPAAAITQAALLRPPQLLERQAQWAQLEAVWAEGGIAVVLGSAGSGKTRLLDDFANQVALPLRLRAHEGDAGVPHALLARWVAAREVAARQLPAWAQLVLAQLHPPLGTAAEVPATPLRLCQALQQLAQADHAICIDDLQFADAASLALLPTVLAGLHCCLLALRGPAGPPALQPWLDAAPRRVRRLQLPHWTPAAVQQLLEQAALPLADPGAWAAQLWQHSGGHPQLLLDTLRALPQPGAADGRPWPLPASWPVPAQAAQRVGAMLASLSPLARDTAHLAALAGEHFSVDLAAAVLGLDLQALGAAWTELQAAGLLSAGGQLHGLVREATAAALPEPVRMALHAPLARGLAERGAAPAVLAWHWQAAGQPAEAAAQHEAAARSAGTQSRRDSQRQHWAQAARLWAQAGRDEAAYDAAGEEAVAVLTAGQASECLVLCDALSARARNPRQWAHVLRLRAWALAYRREWDATLQAVEKALPAVHAAGDPAWLSETLGLHAIVAAQLQRTALAEQALQAARALVIDPAAWELQLNHHSRIADALLYLQRLPEALATYENCLALAERPEARTQRLSLLNNTALLLHRMGRGDTALARAQEALVLAEALGQLLGQVGGQALIHAALLNAAAGRFDTALLLGERSLAVLQALQAPQVRAIVQNHMAWIWCCLGQGARALQLLRSDDNNSDDSLDTLVRLRRWTLRGELQRLCGTAPPGPPPADWADCTDPATRAQAELAMARALPPHAGAARLATLAAELLAQGHAAHALHARVLRVQALAQLPAHQAQAAEEAQAIAADLAHTTPLAAYLPEVWVVLADACRCGAAPEAAARFDAQARAWVQQAGGAHVPAAFREGFEQRNRVNAALLRARA